MSNLLDEDVLDKIDRVEVEELEASPVSSALNAFVLAQQQKVQTELRLRESLEGSRAYETPDLSAKAETCGGYVYDSEPTLYADHATLRRDQQAIHSDALTASVGDNFIDQARFSDANIFLEIIQNAQGLDSQGTWFEVQFYAKGRWHKLDEIAKFKDKQIEAARVVDNGKGFLPTDAIILGGTKKGDPKSAGNFGTGMKISDRSALERDVQVIKYSGNWRAQLGFVDTVTSGGDEKVVSYNVDFYEDWEPGSTAEYWDITPGMIDALRGLKNRYLPLDPTFKPRLIDENEQGLVLRSNKKSPVITVMGRSYELTVLTEFPFMFAYDLKNCVIDDQNRHNVDTARAKTNIQRILGKVSDPQIFVALMRADLDGKNYEELTLGGMVFASSIFMEAAQQVYGITNQDLQERKVFRMDMSTFDERSLLEEKGYKPIDCRRSKFLEETFKYMQVPNQKDLVARISRDYQGDELTAYEGENFASVACRAVMLINHLPIEQRDLKVVCTGGEELSYEEFLGMRKPPSLPKYFVVRADDFYFDDPSIFGSLVAASAKAGVKAGIANNDYELRGMEKSYERASAKMYSWPGMESEDFEFRLEITERTQIKLLRRLREYSLNLDPDYEPYERTPYGDIVRLDGERAIYERGVLNTGSTRYHLVMSYNLNADIGEKLNHQVGPIIGASADPEVPRAVLKAAKGDPQKFFCEFGCHRSDHPELWAQAFKETFGEKAAVLDFPDTLNANQQQNAVKVAEVSGIPMIKVHSNLRNLLMSCGVKGVFEAVQGVEIQEHTPTPMQAVLCSLSDVVEEAIFQAMPQGCISGKLPIKVVRSVENSSEDELHSSGFHYMDPVDYYNPVLYLYEDLFQGENIPQLVEILCNSMLEVYRPHMDDTQFASFRSQVLLNMEGAVNMEFWRNLREAIAESAEKVSEVIATAKQVIQEAEKVESWTFPRLRDARIKTKRGGSAVRQQKPARRGWFNRKPKQRKQKQPREQRQREPMQLPNIDLRGIRSAVQMTAVLVVLGTGGTWLVGQTGALDGLSSWLGAAVPVDSLGLDPGTIDRLERWGFLREAEAPGFDPDKGFERQFSPGREPIGVYVERGNVSRGERRQRRATFFSSPSLRSDQYMREIPLTEYNGQDWVGTLDPIPQFETPEWEENFLIAHMQKLGKRQKVVSLRTQAGGHIDASSIRVLEGDRDPITDFEVVDMQNGDYEVRINSRKANVVLYNTLSPINWQGAAEDLTDEDFQTLNSEAYDYYTATLDGVDLSTIRFSHSSYRGIHDLQGLVDYLMTKPPYERIEELRDIVNDMRYTITSQTEEAYNAFHGGETPEKDFLSFVFNSTMLDQPGDGDCDCQNSIFSLLTRECGIPSRLAKVVTHSGTPHGPSEVFLPGIGWVLMDTMGARSLIEREVWGGNRLPDSTRKPREITPADLEQQLMNQLEYEELGCSELK